MKQKADFDTTYCNSITCKNRCWRHVSNFEFEEGKNYWYINDCMLERYTKKVKQNEDKAIIL